MRDFLRKKDAREVCLSLLNGHISKGLSFLAHCEENNYYNQTKGSNSATFSFFHDFICQIEWGVYFILELL